MFWTRFSLVFLFNWGFIWYALFANTTQKWSFPDLLNAKPSDSLRARMLAFWHRLTTPVVAINDPGDLYKASLLASMFLTAIAVVVVFILLSLIVPNYEQQAELQNFLRAVSVVVLFICYRLCLRGQPDRAVGWGAGITSAILILQSATPGGLFAVNTIYYLGAVILSCGLFTTAAVTVMIFAFQQLIVVVVWHFRPDIETKAYILQAVFGLTMTVFTIAGVYYRRRLDNEKNARIQQSEVRSPAKRGGRYLQLCPT